MRYKLKLKEPDPFAGKSLTEFDVAEYLHRSYSELYERTLGYTRTELNGVITMAAKLLAFGGLNVSIMLIMGASYFWLVLIFCLWIALILVAIIRIIQLMIDFIAARSEVQYMQSIPEGGRVSNPFIQKKKEEYLEIGLLQTID